MSKPATRAVPALGRQQGGEHLDGRALARPVGAQQAKNLALLHSQRHRVDSRPVVKTAGETIGCENHWALTVTVSGSLLVVAPLSSVARAENTYWPAGRRKSTV